MRAMKLKAITFLMALTLTACAGSVTKPVPCPPFPEFPSVSQDTRDYINSTLNDEDGDPVEQAAIRDMVDVQTQTNIIWDGYALKLEERACSQ